MSMVNGLRPIMNLSLLSSIIRLFSSQMALLCRSSCSITHQTPEPIRSQYFLRMFFFHRTFVSPVHRSWSHCWASRFPTLSRPPRLSLMPLAGGRAAGQRPERLSAGARPAGLKEWHEEEKLSTVEMLLSQFEEKLHSPSPLKKVCLYSY